ncbi:MAG: hypothetical protein R3C01_05870 [Planctomycetaceae bacterium]
MMMRSSLLVMGLCGLLSLNGTIVLGEDVLFRVETVGYVDQLATDPSPREQTLRSIEVVARPDEPFRSVVRVGSQTIKLTGTLRLTEKGEYACRFRYCCLTDTGETVLVQEGLREPVIRVDSLDTSMTLPENRSVTLGGLTTEQQNSSEPVRYSKTRHILTITKQGGDEE